MGKTLSLKLNDKEKKKIDRFLKKIEITPSELLRKALWQYVNEVNHEVNLMQREGNHEKVNLVDQKVNLKQQEKMGREVNQVNHSVQIVENYELLRHYKEEIDWLRNRVEYFEGFCKDLHEESFSNADAESKKKPLMTGIRM
ncbi:MAG: hypothetical protein KAV40_01690 [Thermoplasmatales archaeon]|nr:hypothetical protein [Thermoplasmatales archaeon]